MSPTISPVSLPSSPRPEGDIRSTTLAERVAGELHGALGQGQSISLSQEFVLPRRIAPRAAILRAGLARFCGGLVTAAASGYGLAEAFERDKTDGDSSYRETRRQLATTAISVGAGLGVGSLAGLVTAGTLSVGAPIAVVSAIGVAGLIGVGMVSSYSYEWARSKMRSWIPE